MRRAFRIGCDVLDRLITYPDACYLSGCVLPIRMRVTYPDACYLSGCVLPIRMRVTYPDVREGVCARRGDLGSRALLGLAVLLVCCRPCPTGVVLMAVGL